MTRLRLSDTKTYPRCIVLVAFAAIVAFSGGCQKSEQAPSGPKGFASPDAAAGALYVATKTGDSNALLAIFGPGATELIVSGDPVQDKTARDKLEARASATPGIEFVALRYGFFYGPGTWYTREGDIGDQVRQQQVPIIGEGQGVYSFVHIDDAAGATAAALGCPPGAYNIVDGNPSPQHVWLTAFARTAGAPAPPRVSEEEALRASGPDAVYYATRLRGASNEKASRELEFRPRPLEWI